MSENIVSIVDATYKDGFLKLTLDNGSTLQISDSAMNELNDKLPKTKESDKIKELIDMIHNVRKHRIKEFEELDKLAEQLAKKQDDIQKDLDNCTSKVGVQLQSAKIKSVASQKAILQERRHLLKLTHIEEGDLRAQLAKLQRGEKQRKD